MKNPLTDTIFHETIPEDITQDANYEASFRAFIARCRWL